MKNLPKSLHTITVLVNVARVFRDCGEQSNEAAVSASLFALGYHGATDSYGLAEKALKILNA